MSQENPSNPVEFAHHILGVKGLENHPLVIANKPLANVSTSTSNSSNTNNK